MTGIIATTEEIRSLRDQVEAAERRYAIECANHKATIQLLHERRQRIERLRGMLKTNAGWWYAGGNEDRWAACMKAAGDIEPRLDAVEGGTIVTRDIWEQLGEIGRAAPDETWEEFQAQVKATNSPCSKEIAELRDLLAEKMAEIERLRGLLPEAERKS